MGLPGSGKTTLAKQLLLDLSQKGKSVEWLNADDVRKKYDDWDFSYEGRIRQAKRMRDLADASHADIVICDFVAPLDEMRNIFNADITVWMDTIRKGRYEDTNQVFSIPLNYDVRITRWAASNSHLVIKMLSIDKGESVLRSVVKAYSYRICGSLTTMIISFVVTGSVVISATIGATELIIKPFVYWLHERLWNRIKWKRT